MGYMAQNQMTRDPVAQIENFKTQPENPNFPLHRPIFFSFLNSSSFFFFLAATLTLHAATTCSGLDTPLLSSTATRWVDGGLGTRRPVRAASPSDGERPLEAASPSSIDARAYHMPVN
jgi:hypothetical protein